MDSDETNTHPIRKLPSFQELIQDFKQYDLSSPTYSNPIDPLIPKIKNVGNIVHRSSSNSIADMNNKQFEYSENRNLLAATYSNQYNVGLRQYTTDSIDKNLHGPKSDISSSPLVLESNSRSTKLAAYLETYHNLFKTSMNFQNSFLTKIENLGLDKPQSLSDNPEKSIAQLFQSFKATDFENQIKIHEQTLELLHLFKIFVVNSYLEQVNNATSLSSSRPMQTKESTENRRNSHPQSVNELLPLKVKSNDNPKRGHARNYSFGGLNKELSQKKEIVCQHCGSKDTPEWRRGPTGSRTLCNACGLFYSKLIKKSGFKEADIVMKKRKTIGAVKDRRIR